MIISHATSPVGVQDEAVLFSFDDHSIPHKNNLVLTLNQVRKHPANPVLRAGPEGAPDDRGCIIYGSVLPIDGKLRMWYLAWPKEKIAGPRGSHWRPMAYAESDDGVHWVKPNLGLVAWQGSKDNNLCLIDPPDWPVQDFLSVMFDPEDPDPSRRYKAAYIVFVPADELRAVGADQRRGGPIMVTATSADGFRWQIVDPGVIPIKEKFEVSGIYRFGEMYHATGQQLPPWISLPDGRPCGRVMAAYQSPDFVEWSPAKTLAFVRPGYVPAPNSAGEEVHMGAGIWNRGNVLVGLYGMWHGTAGAYTWPRVGLGDVRIDLGLVVSNDGLHFREPLPDFAIIPRGGSGEWDCIGLVQGHAFANMGEKTYIWYAQWDCSKQGYAEEIGLGTLRRDGFGHLSRRLHGAEGHFLTCLLQADKPTRLYVNVKGISPASPLYAELVDEYNRPIPGYAGDDCHPVVEPGVRQPLRWRDREAIADLEGRFRIKVTLAGDGSGEQKVYAVYLASV